MGCVWNTRVSGRNLGHGSLDVSMLRSTSECHSACDGAV